MIKMTGIMTEKLSFLIEFYLPIHFLYQEIIYLQTKRKNKETFANNLLMIGNVEDEFIYKKMKEKSIIDLMLLVSLSFIMRSSA